MFDLKWWHTATGYQIYPRSFADSNSDGIGDIPGIIDRLNHLADLGVGFVWLSPVYASPMADNGYDIADYRAIAPEFGTLADMDRLIAAAKDRDIRIVMDLVVNHTSDQHAWFQTALTDPASPEHAFYIWRDPAPDGGPPSDLQACFGGSAWTYVPHLDLYYLGFFSPQQPDLNWQNPDLRAQIYEMMNWWLDRGLGGFRMDVISLIGKDVDAGQFEEGPDLARFLQEMHRETLAGRDILTVGETWSVTPASAPIYCGSDPKALDMVFQFDHVKQGWDPKLGKFKPRPFDLPRFKQVFATWQDAMAKDGWNALFLTNHDLPRQVSKYGCDGRYRVRSAKALATVLHMLRGTPFVYQGEEIGMTNAAFTRLDQFRDIETLGHYSAQSAQGVSDTDFIAGANANGRDNSRTPMQWDEGPGAGFTTGTPWIEVNANHTDINVATDRADPDGIFAHYQRLIALRRTWPLITLGTTKFHAMAHDQIFAYTRHHRDQTLAVIANLSDRPAAFDVPPEMAADGAAVVWNLTPRAQAQGTIDLAPFEAFAILSSPEPPSGA